MFTYTFCSRQGLVLFDQTKTAYVLNDLKLRTGFLILETCTESDIVTQQ